MGRQVEDLVPAKVRGTRTGTIVANTCSTRRRGAWVSDASSRTPQGRHRGSDRGGSQSDADGGGPSCSRPSSTCRNAGASSRRRRASATKWRISRAWACWARCRDRSRTSINQPLTAILSNAQAAQRFLAQTPPRLDQVAEIIDDIVKNDRRAATVIQRLRALLKKEDAEHRPVDVNEIVQDSLRLMHSDLLSRRVEVIADYDADLPLVSADRVQLSQVMLNFVMNGCEAMEDAKGPRRLLVRTRRAPSGNVEVTVGDRGGGIEPADLEGIFEPFITTKRHGVGLGLAICRTIVDAHGGRIWATNNPDGGATLHFEIPVSHKATIDVGVRDRIRG